MVKKSKQTDYGGKKLQMKMACLCTQKSGSSLIKEMKLRKKHSRLTERFYIFAW